MKPLFDTTNAPPAPNVKATSTPFVPMTFDQARPVKPSRPESMFISDVCKQIDPTLTTVEINRIQQMLQDMSKDKKSLDAFAQDIISLVTDQTEQVFQFVCAYTSTSSSNAITEFTDMVNQVAAYKKSNWADRIMFTAKKPTFNELLATLRSSLSKTKTVESRFEAEIHSLKLTQDKIEQATKTCRNYLKYIDQYATTGKIYLQSHQDDRIERVVEKLEGVYPATLTTAVTQLELLNKTNNILIERIEDIVQVKIPQWKQNATSILVISEQRKLQDFSPDVETNFDALLKLI